MRAFAISAVLLAGGWAGCVSSWSEGEDLDTSSVAQELRYCEDSCDPPIYNGVPVSCYASSHCSSSSGAVHCYNSNGTQQSVYCTPQPFCGDGNCDPGETPQNCSDCSSCEPYDVSYCDPNYYCDLGSTSNPSGQYLYCQSGVMMYAWATPDCRWCINRGVCGSQEGPIVCPY